MKGFRKTHPLWGRWSCSWIPTDAFRLHQANRGVSMMTFSCILTVIAVYPEMN